MHRSRGIWSIVVGLALVAASVLVGCGGGGSQDSSSVVHPVATKKQYDRQAQAYCHRGYLRQARAVERYAKRHGIEYLQPTQPERERLDAAVVLPFVRMKLAYLEGLAVPKGGEAQIQQILDSIEHGIQETEAHPERLAAPTAAHPEPFTRTRELTSAYGFWICGQA